MLAVHRLVLLYVASNSPASSTELAAAESVTCRGQTAEPSAHSRNTYSKGMSLVQVKTKVNKNAVMLPASSVLQLIKRKFAKTSDARSSVVQTKASSRGRVVAQTNLSSKRRSLVQANAPSRGHFIVHNNASNIGPLMVQTNASGNAVFTVRINEMGSKEPRLQKRLAMRVQQGTGFRNDFADFFHQLARSQEAHTFTGAWICVSLLSLMIISCFAALTFINGKSQNPVHALVFLLGIRQGAALSSTSTPGGLCGMRASWPSSDVSDKPAALATTWQRLALQLLLGAAAEAVSSLQSTTRPGAAATHDGSILRGRARRSSMVSDNTASPNPYYLCRDLVVPPGCECILKVPLRCLSNGPFEVCDPYQNAVLRVEPRPLHQAGGGAEVLLKLVSAIEFGRIFAQCMPSMARIAGQSPEREQRECVLTRASGDMFAVIRFEEEHERYTLRTKMDGRLHIWGSKQEQALNVVDASGKLLAKTCSITDQQDLIPSDAMAGQQPTVSLDPNKAYFTLKVAPLVDSGLIICVLLCIHHLM